MTGMENQHTRRQIRWYINFWFDFFVYLQKGEPHQIGLDKFFFVEYLFPFLCKNTFSPIFEIASRNSPIPQTSRLKLKFLVFSGAWKRNKFINIKNLNIATHLQQAYL